MSLHAKSVMRDVMTKTPHSIGHDQRLSFAHELMRKHRIRHLPVLDAGMLVGLLSQRDLFLVETLKDVDPGEVEVSDAMSSDVYSVAPDARLTAVASHMADKKIGCAVVMEGPKVVGVFTTTDALRTLSETLIGAVLSTPERKDSAKSAPRAPSAPAPKTPSASAKTANGKASNSKASTGKAQKRA